MIHESQKDLVYEGRRDVLKIFASTGLVMSSLPVSLLLPRLVKRVAEIFSSRSQVPISEQLQGTPKRTAQIEVDPQTQNFEYPMVNVKYSAPGEQFLYASFGEHGTQTEVAVPLRIPEGVSTFMPDTLPSIFLLTDYFDHSVAEFVREKRIGAMGWSQRIDLLPGEVRTKLSFIVEQYRQWIPFPSQNFDLVAVDELPFSKDLFALYQMLMNSDPERYLAIGTFGVLSKLGMLSSLATTTEVAGELTKKLAPGMPESRRTFFAKFPFRVVMLGLAVSAIPDITNSAVSTAELVLRENYLRGYPIPDKVTVPDKLRFFYQALDQSETLSPQMRAHMWRDLVSVYKIVCTHQNHPEQSHMAAWGNFHLNQLGLYTLEAGEILKLISNFLDKHADEVKSWYPTQIYSICTTTAYKITELDQFLAGKTDATIEVRVLPSLYGLLLKHGFFADKK